MKIRNLGLALVFAGSTTLASLAFAESPAPAQVQKLDDKKADETAEIQHLRAARKNLNEAKDAFDKDPGDAAGHRKEIIEGIDKALVAVDAEIDELLKMDKK